MSTIIRFVILFILFFAVAKGVNVYSVNLNKEIFGEKDSTARVTGSDHGMHDSSTASSSTGNGNDGNVVFGEKDSTARVTGSDHGMHDSTSSGLTIYH